MIIKMVWFKVIPGRVTQFETAMTTYAANLPLVQPGVVDVQWGANLNPISSDEGYTHGYMCRLNDFDALVEYRHHPIHDDLMPVLNATCATVWGVEFDMGQASA